MKGKFTICSVLAIGLTLGGILSVRAADDKFTFRGFQWGTPASVIKTDEKAKFIEEQEGNLIYQDKLFDQDFKVAYIFNQDKLYMGKYHLQATFTDMNEYIRVYNKLKNNLVDKYGRPLEDRVIWSNSKLEFDKNRWGEAVSVGDLMHYALWRQERTQITVKLSGINNKILLEIQYLDDSAKSSPEKQKL